MKQETCYDKLIDALLTGPKDRSFLKKYVGVGFLSRVSEFNKVKNNNFQIINMDGLYYMVRVGKIHVPKTV